MQARVALAIGCVSVLALSLPAYGLPAANGTQTVQMFRAGETPKPAPQGKIKIASRDPHAGAFFSRSTVQKASVPILIAEARKYMGTNPTSRKKLWCATFMNMVLRKTGYAGTNSDAARSFAYYGRRISSPQIGAIAVLSRGRTGGHVGVVTGVDPHGNPIILSGNHGHRVGEGTYPKARVIAYVMPTESRPLNGDRTATVSRASASSFDIESPIAELIAAIEAEQTRADTAKPAAAAQPAQAAPAPAPQPQSVHQALPEKPKPAQAEAPRAEPAAPPHRVVQQMPDIDEAAPIPPRPVPQGKPARQGGKVAAAEISQR